MFMVFRRIIWVISSQVIMQAWTWPVTEFDKNSLIVKTYNIWYKENMIDRNHSTELLSKRLQQITFVTLNEFCLLSNPSSLPLFSKDTIKMDGIPTKTTWKIREHWQKAFFTLSGFWPLRRVMGVGAGGWSNQLKKENSWGKYFLQIFLNEVLKILEKWYLLM